MASVFQMMEIAHTHFWSREMMESTDMSASLLSSQTASPTGSRENLRSPQSPNEVMTTSCVDWGSAGHHGTSTNLRKGSLSVEKSAVQRRSSATAETHDTQQSTTEMFKDMLTQKRNMLLSKLTSFDSEVSGNLFS